MPISIAPADVQDTIRITALIRSAFSTVAQRLDLNKNNCPKHPSNSTEHWVAAEMARGVSYYLATMDQKLVGCVGVEQASADECYLERLAVDPQAQRQGVGAALVAHGIKVARRLGAQKVGVAIIAEQAELSKWYKTLGFTVAGKRSFTHLPFEVAFLIYRI